jgi:hypothetical protein
MRLLASATPPSKHLHRTVIFQTHNAITTVENNSNISKVEAALATLGHTIGPITLHEK